MVASLCGVNIQIARKIIQFVIKFVSPISGSVVSGIGGLVGAKHLLQGIVDFLVEESGLVAFLLCDDALLGAVPNFYT